MTKWQVIPMKPYNLPPSCHIILFSVAFFAMQVIDLWLTGIAISSGNARELNPLYSSDWFVPVKLGMVFVIGAILLRMAPKHPKHANATMSFILLMYVAICLNNVRFALVWR